ncbi:glycoside hydrolase family 43 protein [Sphingosinicella terrae]|uniref:glycoside hydrolase family 43 protein n=1 Tax=Sphingosinicella terrae TaxID=2172047 RepID=UPI0025478B12|nr:glycoside hydrolase family 43 protein [Sphingosinicella terrae]
MIHRFATLLLILMVPACATAPPGETAAAGTYRNPVIDSDFPDPAVLRASDGHYYVYATQGRHDGRMLNIQVARSRDLVAWERLGDALPAKPDWATRTQDFWAPHVAEHDGTFYLYYSAKPDAALDDPSRGLCLAVATSTRPEGPFTDAGAPLQCGDGFVNIDPMAYDDSATERRLLYWGSGFGPIKVQELAPDRISFAPGSRPIDLLRVVPTEDPANYQRLIEGAWVTRHGDYHYLFYSGDNCCGPNAHYALMVARSRSATGPFETLEAADGRASSVILAAQGRWVAPGHNSVAEDAGGNHWILYHAVDARRPQASANDEINTRRVMLIDRIVWRDGWPRIEDDVPSDGERPAPAR